MYKSLFCYVHTLLLCIHSNLEALVFLYVCINEQIIYIFLVHCNSLKLIFGIGMKFKIFFLTSTLWGRPHCLKAIVCFVHLKAPH